MAKDKVQNIKDYTSSPFGAIPKDWEYKTLEEISQKIGDGLHGTPKYVLSSPYYFINGNNLNDGSIDLSNAKCISSEEYEKHKKELNSNTILLSINGTIGSLSFYNQEKVALGKSVAYINCTPDFNTNYLYYVLESNQIKEYFEGELTGSTIRNLSLKTIRSTPIPVPPLNERKKIATILFAWDEAIETLENLIARKERHKKALMQQLLTGKKRFKEFKGEKWHSILIKDLGKVVSGGTPDTNKEEFFNGKILWCTPTEITSLKGRKYIDKTERTITELGLKSSSANILPPNSLIVCTRATVGDCVINSVEMSTNQGFKSIIPNDNIAIDFLYYSFLPMKNILLRLANGSTFLEVSKTDFENISLKVPVSIKEQNKISSVLSAADEEIQSLKTQLEHCKQQKKGLMQVLLTGKKRVKI